ncbi:STAS/SEC14 domain-containing protein [Lacimicrobium alkaliphilum]|uniref:STAS/SEC14 domain-containing protein n=1 Tax=Lacimicrobium alkaliphilum TaxID=1526571 RepID=A0A0U2JI67_9ALTE|nr:STAS/SEC14 domain-containing protein [Lacimicrobium alkaliphilum]ALS97014.1 hypothetical protein AT746_01120 [Lacimicrobium alkaliphilum]
MQHTGITEKFRATHCYDRESGLLHVTASGLAEPEDILAMYNKIMELSCRYDCHRALIDMRAMMKNVDDNRLLVMIDQLDSLLRRIRVARVINTRDSQQNLVQSIADSRNYPLKNFTSQDQALAWLLPGL